MVQCRAWDRAGQPVAVDLDLCPAFDETLRYLRCRPSRNLLRSLAEVLVQADFVPARIARDHTVRALEDCDPERELDLALLYANKEIHRIRRPDDGDVPEGEVLRLGAVELCVRGQRWDDERRAPTFEPVRAPVVAYAPAETRPGGVAAGSAAGGALASRFEEDAR